MGFKPTLSAWKAEVLIANTTPARELQTGFEPAMPKREIESLGTLPIRLLEHVWHPRVESSHLTLLRREGSTSLSVGMEPSERVELSSQRSKRRGQVRWRRLEWTCGDSNPGLAKHTSSCYSHSQFQAGSCTTVPSLRLSQALPRIHPVSPGSPSPLLLPGCGDLALLSCDGKPAGSGLLSSSVFSDGC